MFLSPLFFVIGMLLKMTSPGPTFFLQERVGRGGQLFRIAKFRSMVVNAENVGPALTFAGDPRVIQLGRILRRLKLDELPQLWNVLMGEMSLVGPRPELPRYVAGFTSQQRQVLTVRPGITDLASIVYRQEEDLLGRNPDPEQFYRQVVLPHKLSLNMEYLQRMSFVFDLSLIFQTTISLLCPLRVTKLCKWGGGQ